ncbi:MULTISPECIES: RNA-binding domain-containing protein [Rhizobium/Agrobacterium group]|uniref:RNA-binding domain-containing protein n=1 Tax=Rhizobium/Agrobacterium group TaxID=227290 RepID=UPI00230077A2|nr:MULTISPECIES: RNA-binding domain-containing protein [Rhizobium/Agrobacterium group]MDA5633070.1 putative DNA binding domain-containing protein [Agrobacterium sp. ST15.16.024]MDF1891002.1 putative DNA binding domain-containing protein [Rhizobium rhizogenes]
MASINRELEQLVDAPRETLNVEIKNWLDLTSKAGMAILAKAAIALANHGGGYILLGFSERPDGSFETTLPAPSSLNAYGQDTIARIVSSYAEPSFQVQVSHVRRTTDGYLHPVIMVPGDHRVPIQAKKGSPDQKSLLVGRVYIRRPTPESAEPGTAIEWRELLDRCVQAGRDDLLNAIRGILGGGALTSDVSKETSLETLLAWRNEGLVAWRNTQLEAGVNAPEPLGYYCVTYWVLGDFAPLDYPDLLSKIDKATIRHTGWSPWWVPTRKGIKPTIRNQAIECNLDETGREYVADPAHQDFWRVTPDGKAMLVRGYDEDSHPDRLTPGLKFDITLPIWRIGECLLQAAAFAALLDKESSQLIFAVKWNGLRGRELTHVEGSRSVRPDQVANENDFERTVTLDPSTIQENLPEILYEFLRPLYALFSFKQLSKAMVDEEVSRLRSSRF